MKKYRNLIILIFCSLWMTIFIASQEHLALAMGDFSIVDTNWIDQVVQVPLDKTPIEKYYSRDGVKPSCRIGRITVSPAGNHIVFSVNDDSIWVVGRDGSGLRCLVCGSERAHSPFWSKDGGVITFIYKGGGEANQWHGTFMQVTPDGARQTIIGDFDTTKPGNGLFHPWSYSPDGRYVLRPSGKPLDNAVYVARVKDQKIIAIYKTRASTLNELWFPNSKEVLIEEFLGHGDSKLVIFPLTGKSKTILPKCRMNMEPAIHPSGEFIAYGNRAILEEYKYGIHFLTKDGSKDWLVLQKINPKISIGDMTWSHKGDLLFFATKDQLYFLKLKKQEP